MRAAFFLFLLCVVSLTGYSQGQQAAATLVSGRTCGTDEVPGAQYLPIQQQQQEIWQATQAILQQNSQRLSQQQQPVVIPVVFHVVYNTEEQNISDQQILSQLAVLNADFSRKNADTVNTPDYFKPFAADTGIEFCLASLDPDGNLTTGITRTRTDSTTFSSFTHDVMFTRTGGKDAWNRDQYLNIWICPRITNIAAGEVIGYATPLGSAAATDGVVLQYRVVGAPPYNNHRIAFNLGRTATHEVGHWLGLRHIWGTSSNDRCDDTDLIDDTPNQGTYTTGCPVDKIISCNNGPNGNMWQNYMDYTDDACMNLFTWGQAARMQAILTTVRASILTSPACTGDILADFELTTPHDTLIAAGTTVTFTDKSTGTKPTSWFWQFEGGTPATSIEQNPVVTYTTPGTYSVSLTASKGALTDTKTKENYVHVTVSDITIYPVPAKDELLIEQQAREEVRYIEMINQTGQTVLQQQFNERVVRLRISHLPAGVYFLRIQSTDAVVLKKVVVVK